MMALLPLIAFALWLALATHALVSRTPQPKKGLRRTERHLLIATVIVAAAWLARADFRTQTTQASVMATKTQHGSCASLEAGMPREEVLRRVGEPDEQRSEEETRGPGASLMTYRASRCTVHLFDDRVEFVD